MADTIFGIKGGPIQGVEVKNISVIPDERGAIYHMLRNDDPIFEKFGEIYFSKANPGVVKAWHLHKEMTLMYSVVVGMAKLVLYDDRKESSTKGNLMEIFIGEDNRLLVKVPPMVWNGFKCISAEPVIVANCATLPHDKNEITRLDPLSKKIPYSWEIVHG
ncbi:MAG TPA: dTDP-4-dehydrorhamnose 3,5-epimerase family protein [Candidatus Udaeobacter sp.]|nr:dTDP-4-dehydrorhamnose 3,5-epimerase family protein [Candidatus Udaeobacter sp.]